MENKYKNPSLTADAVVLGFFEKQLKVLLIERGNPPFKNNWAMPGGFVDYDEEIDIAANRELEEETGLKNLNLIEFKTYGTIGRDPRGRTVSVVYYSICDGSILNPIASDDAKNLDWYNLSDLPDLAFDHDMILNELIEYLKFISVKLTVDDFSQFTRTEKALAEKIKEYFQELI
ncbi:MAG: NUDIX hydrolase [bacterium]